MPATHEVRLPGGRTLHAAETGDPRGVAVIAHPGTPGGALPFPPAAEEDARSRGIRLVAYDRPGYAGSTPQPGRSVADAAADTAAVADALGIGRFATYGLSGGGPHALACAALLPDRVSAAVTVSSPAPRDAECLDWYAGQGEDNVREHRTAEAGAEPLRRLLAPAREGMLAARPEQMEEGLGTLLSEPDRRILTHELSAWLLAAGAHGMARGVEGWVDDDRAFVTGWGFSPADVRVPVRVWHGAHDRFIPVAHGRWLAAAIPGAETEISEADGHLSLTTGRLPDVHAWLVQR